MLNATKDALSSRVAQSYLNRVIARYGEIAGLALDSTDKTIEATLVLRGETQRVHVLTRYTLEVVEGEKFVRLLTCESNKPWVENLLTDFGRERPWPLPAWAAALL